MAGAFINLAQSVDHTSTNVYTYTCQMYFRSMYSKPHFPVKDSYPPNVSIIALNMLTQVHLPANSQGQCRVHLFTFPVTSRPGIHFLAPNSTNN